MHFARLTKTLLKAGESARDNHVLACNFAKYSLTDSAETFLNLVINNLTTLHCKLSLIACFADIKVSQGSVATYERYSGILNIHLTANLPRNLPVKKIS